MCKSLLKSVYEGIWDVVGCVLARVYVGSLVWGHRPVNVKRAVIGSKGGWKLSTIFLSCKVFHDWSIIKLGNILYLLDGSIFAVLFGTTSHCFCCFSLVVWLSKKDLAFWYFFQYNFPLMCPPSGAKKWQNMAVTRVSHSCFLIELGPICNSMAASLWLKSCEDHGLLKSYNGGLWKNNYRSRPYEVVWGGSVASDQWHDCWANRRTGFGFHGICINSHVTKHLSWPLEFRQAIDFR